MNIPTLGSAENWCPLLLPVLPSSQLGVHFIAVPAMHSYRPVGYTLNKNNSHFSFFKRQDPEITNHFRKDTTKIFVNQLQ